MALFQYQALAEPVRPSATFGETTQVDKWYVRPADPPRQRQRATTVLGHFTVDAKLLTTKERVNLDKWYRQPVELPQMQRRRFGVLGPPHLGWFAVDAKQMTLVERTQVDKWYVRPQEVPRPLKRLTDRDALDLVTPESSKGFPWQLPNQPSRPLPRLTDREGLDMVAVTVTAFDPGTGFPWQEFEPPPRGLRRLIDREAFDYGTVEVTQAFPWLATNQPLPLPLRRLTDRDGGRPNFFAVFAGVFNPATGFPWPEPEPAPRQLKRELTYDGWSCTTLGKFVAETVTADRWYVAPTLPVRKAKAVPDPLRSSWSFPVVPTDWLPAPALPTRARRSQSAELGTVPSFPAVTVLSWYAPTVQPVKGKARTLPDAATFVRVAPTVVPPTGWMTAWTEPVRAPRRNAHLWSWTYVPVVTGLPVSGRWVATQIYVPGSYADGMFVPGGGAEGFVPGGDPETFTPGGKSRTYVSGFMDTEGGP